MMRQIQFCNFVQALLLLFGPCQRTTAFATWRPRRVQDAHQTNHQASLSSSQDTTTNGVETGDGKNIKTCDILSLDSIRQSLIRQEETIIFALIERAQYRLNPVVYEKKNVWEASLGVPLGSLLPEGNASNDDDELSLLEYMLIGTEVLHGGIRRYVSPEEHAFFPERISASPMGQLPSLSLPNNLLSPIGGASEVNFNKRLLQRYVGEFLQQLCKPVDDEQYGSTVLADIAVLQALSRRIHYGKFVAESKYRSAPEEYQALVDNDDADGVMELLTNPAVEATVLRRARLKAATYGTDPVVVSDDDDATAMVAAAAASAVVATMHTLRDTAESDQPWTQTKLAGKVDPLVIERIYRELIIPMTKDVEVAYLFRRCGKEPPSEYLEGYGLNGLDKDSLN